MKISIIIPTYNRIQFVTKSIDSCINQIIPESVCVNIVVVNDGSTDKTEEILRKKYGNSIHLLNIKNSERGAARNFGADYSISNLNSDWLLFLDADDCLDMYGLDGLIKHCSSNYDMVSGRYVIWRGNEVFDKILPIRKITNKHQSTMSSKIDVLNNDWIPLGATLFNSKIFNETKGFIEDRHLSGSEDKVFTIHCALLGNIKFTNHVVTWYRQHEANTSVSRFSESMCLAFSYLEPIIKRYQSQISGHAIRNLRNHMSYLLIGAHNSNLKEGKPFTLLMHLILKRPILILKFRTWKYLLSILKNYLGFNLKVVQDLFLKMN